MLSFFAKRVARQLSGELHRRADRKRIGLRSNTGDASNIRLAEHHPPDLHAQLYGVGLVEH